jgi:Transposase DDE domain/Transposase domain (DUF772)
MLTCKSPRTVTQTAYHLATRLLPEYSCKFSRHDYTLAQLFACLVLREFHGASFRGTEEILRDNPQLLADIGLRHTPDHNTLCRAFKRIVSSRNVNRMLDVLVRLFAEARLLGLNLKPLTIDSTMFERQHRSGHYDRRCRRMAMDDARKVEKHPGKWGASVNAARSRHLKSMPKLAIAAAASCHLIIAFKVRTGNGSDAPDFKDLLYDADRRVRIGTVVADAGYDSEANHCLARQKMGVRAIIPPGIGRPTKKLPTGRWRRHMARRFARKADKKKYSQRSQSETVNSMIKRNQGSALRARTAEGREKEMMLRVLVHNIALLCDEMED